MRLGRASDEEIRFLCPSTDNYQAISQNQFPSKNPILRSYDLVKSYLITNYGLANKSSIEYFKKFYLIGKFLDSSSKFAFKCSSRKIMNLFADDIDRMSSYTQTRISHVLDININTDEESFVAQVPTVNQKIALSTVSSNVRRVEWTSVVILLFLVLFTIMILLVITSLSSLYSLSLPSLLILGASSGIILAVAAHYIYTKCFY